MRNHSPWRVPLAVALTGFAALLVQSAGIYLSVQKLQEVGAVITTEVVRLPMLAAGLAALACFVATGWKLVRPLTRRQALCSAGIAVAYSYLVLALEQLGQRAPGLFLLVSLSQLLYLPLTAQVNITSLAYQALPDFPGGLWAYALLTPLLPLCYLPFARGDREKAG